MSQSTSTACFATGSRLSGLLNSSTDQELSPVRSPRKLGKVQKDSFEAEHDQFPLTCVEHENGQDKSPR